MIRSKSTFTRVARPTSFVAMLVAAACADRLPGAFACKEIPEGGCPQRSIDVCVDDACEAVYSCNANAEWTQVRECTRDVSADAADAGYGANDMTGDSAIVSYRDAASGTPDGEGAFGGPGCIALEAPECSLGFALGCHGSDCCGCEDIFVCDQGGWSAWGTCNRGALAPSFSFFGNIGNQAR
jgi:hypothetical protein